MKIIYVSGPLSCRDSHSGMMDNVERAERVSIELFARGWGVFTPHKNISGYWKYDGMKIYKTNGITFDYNLWMSFDIEMLMRCDAIFMMEKWSKSKGAKIELAHAIENKIPIFYEKKGYPWPCDLDTRK